MKRNNERVFLVLKGNKTKKVTQQTRELALGKHHTNITAKT